MTGLRGWRARGPRARALLAERGNAFLSRASRKTGPLRGGDLTREGLNVGLLEGLEEGRAVGLRDGTRVGLEGCAVGVDVGKEDGAWEGLRLGASLGFSLGASVGLGVGAPLGPELGVEEGNEVGPGEGITGERWIVTTGEASECMTSQEERGPLSPVGNEDGGLVGVLQKSSRVRLDSSAWEGREGDGLRLWRKREGSSSSFGSQSPQLRVKILNESISQGSCSPARKEARCSGG